MMPDDTILEDVKAIEDWIAESEAEADAIASGRKSDTPLSPDDRAEVARLRDEVRPDEDALAEQLVKDLRASA